MCFEYNGIKSIVWNFVIHAVKYFIATIIAFKMPLMQITECIKTSGAEPQTPLLLLVVRLPA